ncbi:uncharacterized protein N7483_006564 [Penicillium malachiteum]|uniref:uncharacterized protein n=1 Tax=Penicillium malachiteum TaxID=1324776 RepID=UPI002547F005|nr:uncharacterized protein N7483_006564 [Penicillium malachiteum]KAJ5725207.1 hypothetical protein N7483_006564 [Penicillium malachiteum]
MALPSRSPCRVMIIGGGVSGIAMACRLKEVYGLDDLCIYDRQEGLGGAWWANTYPGCAVDIPGFCYSFSFAPNPDFTKLFPAQSEVLTYLSTVVRQYRIDEQFIGGTEWINAAWNEETETWLVTLRNNETGQFTQECKVLISAVGGLVNPQGLKVPGVETFQGEIIHTARWNHDVDLTNKHVAVIGNGASAVQLVPAILNRVKSVTQFMRTPHHIVKGDNYDISPEWRNTFHQFPLILWLIRIAIFLWMEITWFRFQNNKLGQIGRAQVEKRSREYVQKSAPESYWDMLIPKYEFGCKRRVFDRGYLATLEDSKMRLTDDPIVEIKPNSIVTRSGEEVHVDAILLANGFALTHYDVDIKGRNGKTRAQHWKEYGHKATFNTIAMNGFPNFFYILGPNSGRLYTSTIQIIESQVDMVLRIMEPIMLQKASSVEVKASSEREYDVKLHDAIGRTVHSTLCGSYFIDKNTDKNWFVYPWNTFHLWLSTLQNPSDHWDYNVGLATRRF